MKKYSMIPVNAKHELRKHSVNFLYAKGPGYVNCLWILFLELCMGFPVAQTVKNLPEMQETQV